MLALRTVTYCTENEETPCQRERSLEDRRVVNIALTPEGRAVAERLPAILTGVQDELLAGFSEAEEAQLRDFLARIYANTRAMPGS